MVRARPTKPKYTSILVHPDRARDKDKKKHVTFATHLAQSKDFADVAPKRDLVFFRKWDVISLPFLVYETFSFPFRISVGEKLSVIDVVCDCFWLFDLCYAIFSLVFPNHNVSEYYSLRKMTMWFQKISLFLGALSLITTYCGVFLPVKLWGFFLLLLPRLVRIPRINFFFTDRMADPHSHVRVYALAKFVLLLYFSIHWIGCFWFFAARLYEFQPNTWFSVYLRMCLQKDAEVGKISCVFPESGVARKYLVGVIWGLNSLTNFGYFGIDIMNSLEAIVGIFVIFAQILFYAYILGTIVHYLVSKDEALELYKRKMTSLQRYLSARQFPYDLTTRIQRYFSYQLSKQEEDSTIFDIMPLSLRLKVSYFQHSRTVERATFFRGCSPPFLNEVMSRLRFMYLMPGEEFVKKADSSREIAFLVKGIMEVWNGSTLISTMRHDAEQVAILGDLALFMKIPQPYTLKSTNNSDATLVVLSRANTEQILETYPDHEDIIISNILSHLDLDRHGRDLRRQTRNESDLEFEELRAVVRASLLKRCEDDLGALTFAASEGDIEVVKSLLKRGVDVNGSDYDGRATLHLACAEGNLKVVQTLVDMGADVSLRDRWGGVPLHDAIAGGHDDIAAYLVRNGASVQYDNPITLLCDAAQSGNVQQLKRLLKFGVDVACSDYDKRTVLHSAAHRGNLGVVHFLMDQDVSVNVRDCWNNTPLQDAVTAGHKLVAKLLRSRGGELNLSYAAGFLCSAACEGDVPQLTLLLENGANVDEGDYDLRTALHLAASEGQLWSVDCLLFNQANVNCKDRWSATPLDCAISAGFWDLAKLLHANGGMPGLPMTQQQSQEVAERLEAHSILDVRNLLRDYDHHCDNAQSLKTRLSRDITHLLFYFVRKSRRFERSIPQYIKRMPVRIVATNANSNVAQQSVSKIRRPTMQSSVNSRDAFVRGGDFLHRVVLNFPKVTSACALVANLFDHATTGRSRNVDLHAAFRAAQTRNNGPAMTLPQLEQLFSLLGIIPTEAELTQVFAPKPSKRMPARISRTTPLNSPDLGSEAELSDDGFDNDLEAGAQSGDIRCFADLLVRSAFRRIVADTTRSVAAKMVKVDEIELLSAAIIIIEETFMALDEFNDGALHLDVHTEVLGYLGGVNIDSNCDKLNINQFVYLFMTWVLESHEHSELEDSGHRRGSRIAPGNKSFRRLSVVNSDLMEAWTAPRSPAHTGVLQRLRALWTNYRKDVRRIRLFVKLGLDSVYAAEITSAFRNATNASVLDRSIDFNTFGNIMQEFSDRRLAREEIKDLFSLVTTDLSATFSVTELEFALRDFKRQKKVEIEEMKSNLGAATNDQRLPEDAPRLIIDPSSRRLAAWNFAMVFTAFFYFFVVPFRIVFLVDVTYADGYWIIDYCVDAIVWIDIFVHFCTAYKNNKSVLVYSRRKIALRYLSGGFQRDALMILPVDLLLRFSGAHIRLVAWLRLPRMLRFHLITNYFNEEKSNVHKDTVFAGVKRLLLYVVLLAHIFACLWAWIGKNNSVSWLDLHRGYGLRPQDGVLDTYLLSFYWVWATLSTVGGGSIAPVTDVELVVMGVVLSLNLTGLAWITGEVSNLVLRSDEHIAALRKQLKSVDTFVHNRQLPLDLQEEIRQFFQFKFTSSAQGEQEEVYQSLSHALQLDVAKNASHSLLESCTLLDGADSSFTGGLAVLLKEVTFPPDTVLIRQGEVARLLFFVARGEVLNTRFVDGTESTSVASTGDTVGELPFIYNMLHFSTAIVDSASYVTAFTLSQNDFKTLTVQYPEQTQLFCKNVDRYWEQAMMTNRTSRSRVSSVGSQVSTSVAHTSSVASMNRTFRALAAAKKTRVNALTVEFLYETYKGNIDRVKKLATGQDFDIVNAADYDGRTALMLAASENHGDLVGLFIDLGANVNIKDRFGNRAIMDAIRHRHFEVAARLFAVGCMLTYETPGLELNAAVARGDLELVKALIKCGIDVNCKDGLRRTPLHIAAHYGRLEILNFLLDEGADAHAVDDRQGTPLKASYDQNHSAVVYRLQQYPGASLGTFDVACELCQAAATDDVDTLKSLFNSGVSVNTADYDNRTPLHLAASNARLVVLNFLLSMPSLELNPLDRLLHTPLDDAVRERHNVSALLLKEAGALRSSAPQMAERVAIAGQKAKEAVSAKRQAFHVRLQELEHGVAVKNLEEISKQFEETRAAVDLALEQLQEVLEAIDLLTKAKDKEEEGKRYEELVDLVHALVQHFVRVEPAMDDMLDGMVTWLATANKGLVVDAKEHFRLLFAEVRTIDSKVSGMHSQPNEAAQYAYIDTLERLRMSSAEARPNFTTGFL